MLLNGLDILCPFTAGKVVLIGGLSSGERDEDEDENDVLTSNPMVPPSLARADSSDEELQPDLEDDVDTNNADPKKTRGWIKVDEAWLHKSMLLRMVSKKPSLLVDKGSKDRLKHIRGFSTFTDEHMKDVDIPYDNEGSEAAKQVKVSDPILTLVRCNHQNFLAAGLLVDMFYQNKSVSALPSYLVSEPTVHLQAQIMCLIHLRESATCNTEDLKEHGVWEWTGTFEQLPGAATARDFEGRWIELIDPDNQPYHSRDRGIERTYRFQSETLCAASSVLFERISNAKEVSSLPSVSLSSTFPYRDLKGEYYSQHK